jgi:hypothetical protein
MKDSQRSKVYKWEREIWAMVDLKATLTLDECKSLIREMHRDADISLACRFTFPSVLDGRGNRRASYNQTRHQIKLPRWARSKWVVCHEYAHYLVDSTKYEAHGAEFVSALIALLVRYAKDEHGMREDGLRAMAIDMGVKVA